MEEKETKTISEIVMERVMIIRHSLENGCRVYLGRDEVRGIEIEEGLKGKINVIITYSNGDRRLFHQSEFMRKRIRIECNTIQHP